MPRALLSRHSTLVLPAISYLRRLQRRHALGPNWQRERNLDARVQLIPRQQGRITRLSAPEQLVADLHDLGSRGLQFPLRRFKFFPRRPVSGITAFANSKPKSHACGADPPTYFGALVCNDSNFRRYGSFATGIAPISSDTTNALVTSMDAPVIMVRNVDRRSFSVSTRTFLLDWTRHRAPTAEGRFLGRARRECPCLAGDRCI